MAAMDTTTGHETANEDIEVDELIASLDHVDSAEAPEIAAQIASSLTADLDAVPAGGSAEQLRAFDSSTRAEG